MSAKTDCAADVGRHRFEVAGLGLAPFRFVGFSVNVIQYSDGSSQAGGSCDYCGAGIANECQVQSSDGKRFKVGCDCIAKVGDEGLLQAFKTSPQVRAHNRKLASAKAARVTAELSAMIEAAAPELAKLPHPRGFVDRSTGKPLTRLDSVRWYFNACGAAGRGAWLRGLKSGKATL